MNWGGGGNIGLNKARVLMFVKLLLLFSRFDRERVNDVLSFSNISAENTAPCSGQRKARRPWLDQP